MHGSILSGRSGATGTKRGAIALCALLALVAPRLLPAAPLDLVAGTGNGPIIDQSEEAAANFPGSAFFYAEGAFDPAPGTPVIEDKHVLGLDKVAAAPAALFRGMTAVDDYRALNCLTSALYYEAGNEPEEGQRAVAQVVLNRVHSPLWPNSVCGVVYQGSERTDMRCQFTFSCDGSMARTPSIAAWARSRRIAQDALSGQVYAPVGLATHYHTLAVRPVWASSLKPVAVVGAHIFYQGLGFNGTPGAFRVAYSRRELISGPARTIWPARPVAPAEVYTPAYAAPAYPDIQAARANPAPAPGWTPLPKARVAPPDDGLPESTIRAEYRNTGRPLI